MGGKDLPGAGRGFLQVEEECGYRSGFLQGLSFALKAKCHKEWLILYSPLF